MAKTYHFKEGYIQISNQIIKKNWIHNIFYLVLLTLIFLIVLWFTDYVFSSTVSTDNYYEIISLGAVFATIGSSVISITSLACGYYFDEFKKTNAILLTYNSDSKNTNTWNFFEDNKTILKSAKHTITYQKFFPEVVFEFGISSLPIPIPSNKKELIFWRVIKSYIKMKTTEKLYFERLEQNRISPERDSLFVWECTTYMLRNALLYKFSLFLTTLGSMFFIAGLFAIFIRS